LAVWLEPAVGSPLKVAYLLEWRVMGFSTGIALLGMGLAFLFYYGGYRAPAHAFAQGVPRFVALVRDKFRIDELYGFIILRPLQVFCRLTFAIVDRILIDKILIGSWAFVADLAGRVFRFFQTGDVQRYLAVFVLGLTAMVWIAARPATPNEVRVMVEGNVATVSLVDADSASGNLTYSFDFDGDGTVDRQGKMPSATWIYSGADRYTVTIVIDDARWHTRRTIKRDITIR
jgi:hypothetical protein